MKRTYTIEHRDYNKSKFTSRSFNGNVADLKKIPPPPQTVLGKLL